VKLSLIHSFSLAKIQKNMSEAQIENMMVVLFSYNNLAEWVSAERTLKDINQINKLEVQAIGNGKVQFKLSYIGALEKLLPQLRARSLRLDEHDGYYSLEKY